MAIVIEANYSKKLGPPAYSSHSYSLTIRSEIADLRQVEHESSKLYTTLQGSEDREFRRSALFRNRPTPELPPHVPSELQPLEVAAV